MTLYFWGSSRQMLCIGVWWLQRSSKIQTPSLHQNYSHWSLCTTEVMYGMGVWTRCIIKVYQYLQHSIASQQKYSYQSSDPMCHVSRNWKTMESHIDILILMFMLYVWCICRRGGTSFPTVLQCESLQETRTTLLTELLCDASSYIKSPYESFC